VKPAATDSAGPISTSSNVKRVGIIYATQGGTCRTYAHKLFSALTAVQRSSAEVGVQWDLDLVDAAKADVDSLHRLSLCVVITGTGAGGVAPPNATVFSELLKDMSDDFRVPRDHFSQTRFAIFGVGSPVYGDHFNQFAKDVADWVRGLGAKFLVPPVYAAEQRSSGLFAVFLKSVVDRALLLAKQEGNDDEDPEDDDEGQENEEDSPDLEELGGPDASSNELLYPRLRENLSKQGYQLIGSHSGVKLCRWTKSMLRGRGGCYKHTFYNISSFQCMEMTPSLACANKCVFCWRHHTNPVTRAFTWKHDTPQFLVEQAIAAHQGMVKQMKGVPGVQSDRFTEAMNVRHCALSLVGEPIIYPEINGFLDLLHQRHISTFMVTNAQFPDRIKQLTPVTQLYVSIDAATKEDLRKIDRPIFEDFWERMLDCIKEMGLKRQRTVFRLTLVKGYNVNNVEDYAKLVHLGHPDFIEVKGVTFCGASDSSDLTMKHVPYHAEVVKFCEDLCAALDGEYDIACEHEHSCCMLLAKKSFKIDNVWHTWIDYAKFFELVKTRGEDFTSLDYAAPTPSWAIFRSEEHGFDPLETRHKRNETITSGC